MWIQSWSNSMNIKTMTIPHTVSSLHTEIFRNEIACSVVFGTPSKNCQGSGICMVAKPAFTERIACRHVDAFVSSPSAGTLWFRFPASKAEHRALAERYFRVEEAFVIPGWLLAKSSMKSAVINPGSYPVLNTADGRWVIFCVDCSGDFGK